jgi:hypothetical protein
MPWRLYRAWNALISKSTTEPSDVHGILAALVNLSAGEILSLPEHECMKAIIRSQAKIPLALFFQPSSNADLHHSSNESWVPQLPGLENAKYYP